jgi:CubicO group peptidase (beta-lactamase class C family)
MPLPTEAHVKRIRFLYVAVGLLLAGAVTFAAQAPPKPTPVALEPQALGAFLSQEVAGKDLVGLSLAVMRDGKVIYAGGAGKSSIAAGAPVAPDTRFAIGSITKQFTSACVLLLAEDGKLSPTDKVAKWFPDLTKASEITLLDLMNHVSGYPDYYPLDFVDRPMQKPIAVEELIRTFGTRTLDFEPGTRYSYSNTGFVILGRIVSKVSGEPFAAFLERRILKPLGMLDTVFEPETMGPSFAQGYVTFALGPPEVATPEGLGWVDAAGALYSTPSDLVKWDLALMDGKVLKPESNKVMTTPRKLADGTASGYGCGLAVSTRSGQTVLSHNGAVAGFYALNTMVPASRSAVVLLSNLDSYDAVNAAYARLMSAILPAPPASKPAEPAAAKKAPPPPTGVPAIAGPPAPEAARLMFLSLQKGQVDRALLGEEYSYFLTDEKIRGAAARLKPFGEPVKVDVESLAERGGMEVARTRLVFASGALKGLMYRTPDGKIQQFFVLKE